MKLKEKWFSDHGMTEMATAYGTLQTRILELELDIRGLDGEIRLGELHNELLNRWGFDLSDAIDVKIEPSIRRITFYQKWWNRDARMPAAKNWE